MAAVIAAGKQQALQLPDREAGGEPLGIGGGGTVARIGVEDGEHLLALPEPFDDVREGYGVVQGEVRAPQRQLRSCHGAMRRPPGTRWQVPASASVHPGPHQDAGWEPENGPTD